MEPSAAALASTAADTGTSTAAIGPLVAALAFEQAWAIPGVAGAALQMLSSPPLLVAHMQTALDL